MVHLAESKYQHLRKPGTYWEWRNREPVAVKATFRCWDCGKIREPDHKCAEGSVEISVPLPPARFLRGYQLVAMGVVGCFMFGLGAEVAVFVERKQSEKAQIHKAKEIANTAPPIGDCSVTANSTACISWWTTTTSDENMMVDHCDSSPGNDSYCTVSRSTGTGAALNVRSATNGTNFVGSDPLHQLDEYQYCGSPYRTKCQIGEYKWFTEGGSHYLKIFDGKGWIPLYQGSK